MAAEQNYVEALEVINPVVENWHTKKVLSTCGISLEQHILLQGDILFLLEDFDASVQIYYYALKVNNFSADACFGIGKCYKAAEMFDEAREMLNYV